MYDIQNDVTNWQCYEHVATVLGHKEAAYQLNMVLNYLVHHDLPVNPNVFKWKDTPQGKVFWSLIFNNQIPKSY